MFFRPAKPSPRVRLPEVMRLKGIFLSRTLSPEEARRFEEAKSRCLACIAGGLCEETLAAGDAKAFSLFCLNCHYMQQVKNEALRFR